MTTLTWVVFKTVINQKTCWLYMDARDIYAAISNGDAATDLYTDMFPEGITVDEPITEVMNKHTEALHEAFSSEDDEDEPSGSDPDSDTSGAVDIIFEPDSDSGITGNFVLDSDILLD